MAQAVVAVEPVDAGDGDAVAYVESVLDDADLPTADVRDAPATFYVATADDGARVGVGGLESYGNHGLLRSLAVEPAARGRGYGTAICDALEARARDADVEALWLLTTTASAFFAARGYEPVDRNAAPDGIRDTTEFSDICPSSATCMKKSL